MRHITLLATVLLVLTIASCATPGGNEPGSVVRPSSGGHQVPPTSDTDRPPPLPDRSTPVPPLLTPVTPVPGTRERTVPWRLISQSGDRSLVLEVAIGGPPCDAVTGIDVDESATAVTITVHTGALASADCSRGIPAIIGTVRVIAELKRPLESRRLIDGSSS